MKVLLNNDYQRIELQNGIVIQTFKITSLDLETTQKLTAERVKVFAEKSYPLIANIRSIKFSRKKAREFFASEKGCEGIIAAALLVDNTLGSMIGNFFIKVNNPRVPSKAFSNEIDAKKWLAPYVKKDQ